MSPTLALTLWIVFLLGLLCFDPAKETNTSPALWVPLIWIFILASRLPSQWLGQSHAGQAIQALEDGNPLDRAVFSFLIVLSIGILVSRSFRWGDFFARNSFLTAFLLFALISVIWSDFPFIAFKRWCRDLGDYLAILVVLSDPDPLKAFRVLLRRLCYFLLPLSVLLIKYYPDLAKHYDPWTGVASIDGVTTSKNMLGALCLVCGIFLVWDTAVRWVGRREPRTKKILIVNVSLIAMALWLLHLANSATSQVCLLIGTLIISATYAKTIKRRPTVLKTLIPSCIVLYVLLAFGFHLNGNMAEAVGRNPTLTDRTIIWAAVLSTNTNPLLGTGYESFWLGPRLERVWALAGHVNEAHNGYLEVYLNLGLIGVSLLVGFLIATYRNICRILYCDSGFASFSLAVWVVALFYNMTEAAYKGSLLWLIFLIGVLIAPVQAELPSAATHEFDNAQAAPQLSRFSQPALRHHQTNLP